MFAIKVGDTFLDLEQSPVRFEIINSIFEQGALQGDWSFPFPIKWSDKNGAAFGFANMLEVPNKKISYPATFYFGTKQFLSGRLILSGGGNNYFNANIAGGVKALINAEVNLKELNYINPITGNGTIVLSSVATAALDYQSADYTNIIAFPPHSNPNFYGNSNPDFQGIVNVVIAEDGTHPLNTPAPGGNKYCLVPWVYLFYILKTGFKESGLIPAGTFWNDSEMAKKLIYNNYALDRIQEQGCVVKTAIDYNYSITIDPLTEFTLPHLDTEPGCSDEENNWSNVVYEFVAPADGSYSFQWVGQIEGLPPAPYTGGGYVNICLFQDGVLKDSDNVYIPSGSIVPVTFLAAVINVSSASQFKIVITNGLTVVAPGAEHHYDLDITILQGATFTVKKYDGQVYNKMSTLVTIKNHVPDITFEELLNEMKKALQLDFVYDFINNKVYINYIEDILKNPPELDLTENLSKQYELLFDDKNRGYVIGYDFGTTDNLVSDNFKNYDASKFIGYYNSKDDLPASTVLGNFAIVKSTNKVMRFDLVQDSFVWIDYTDNYYNVTTGNGETEVKTKLAPMMMIETENETNIAPDPANTRALIPAISETGSSPIFDLGENAASLRIVFMRGMNVSGGQYVCASSTNFDQLGVQNGSHTLKMNDSDGIYKKLHEKIITALTNSDIVERDMLADINLLSDARLKRKVSAGNMHWLLYSFSALIGNTIKLSKSKWLKL